MKVGDRVRVRVGVRPFYEKWFSYDHGGTEGVITSIGGTRKGCDCIVRFTTGTDINQEWQWPFSCLELLSPSQEDFVSGQPEELDASFKVGDWIEMVKSSGYVYSINGAKGVVIEVYSDYIKVDWKSGLNLVPKDPVFTVLASECKKIPAQSVERSQQNNGASATEEKQQTKDKTMVFRVTAILTPSVLAQQNGAVESVLIDNEAVVATDGTSAALVAGAKNADAVNKATGGTVRVHVSSGI